MSPTPGRTSDGPGRRSFGVDGSLRDDLFGDAFASSGDAFAESRLVFLEGNRLPERFRELAESALPSFSVAEIGFGTGANFALCAELFFRLCPDRTLEYEGLEGYPLSPGELRAAHARWPGELKPWAEALQKTWDEGKDELAFRNARLHLRFGLFADVLPALERKADAWILDGFAPSKNPDAWSDALFAQIARLSAPGATAATSRSRATCAAASCG
ncbi:MAG: tRNA (5-methylaminomethyl-2-thiouridine)(34)-methyltransferase MnmD, partial [Fibrobacterales bacterium]|nr:tRNA (5-methylaminomethyl-2-thiouridine)(34)-methyltransferase MnmD [Fibrobacterales bacterium]